MNFRLSQSRKPRQQSLAGESPRKKSKVLQSGKAKVKATPCQQVHAEGTTWLHSIAQLLLRHPQS